MLGLVISPVLFVAGLVLAGIAAIEWLIQAWADRATGDPATNAQIRNRLMYPVEIPLAGAHRHRLVVVAAFSRVLLALPKEGSNAIAIGVAALILAVGALVAHAGAVLEERHRRRAGRRRHRRARGRHHRRRVGEREFHPHTEEHEEEPAEDGLGTFSVALGAVGPMTRRLRVLAPLLRLALVLAACGDERQDVFTPRR